MKNYVPQVELLNKEMIQSYLRISRATFYRLKKLPSFPKPISIQNGIPYWVKEDLLTFLSEINYAG